MYDEAAEEDKDELGLLFKHGAWVNGLLGCNWSRRKCVSDFVLSASNDNEDDGMVEEKDVEKQTKP